MQIELKIGKKHGNQLSFTQQFLGYVGDGESSPFSTRFYCYFPFPTQTSNRSPRSLRAKYFSS